MSPLNQYEITELMHQMDTSIVGAPIGSMWTNLNVEMLFIVLFHANLWDGKGPALVMQNLPGGECWVVSAQEFFDGRWINVGFVWDREGSEE